MVLRLIQLFFYERDIQDEEENRPHTVALCGSPHAELGSARLANHLRDDVLNGAAPERLHVPAIAWAATFGAARPVDSSP